MPSHTGSFRRPLLVWNTIATSLLLLLCLPNITMMAQAWFMTSPIPSHRHGFAFSSSSVLGHGHGSVGRRHTQRHMSTAEETARSSADDASSAVSSDADPPQQKRPASAADPKNAADEYDYTVPEDAVVHIRPAAMRRLRELKAQQQMKSSNTADDDGYLTLRMGVRSGGCSGMSYVMDFCQATDINYDDDQVDVYESDQIRCVVDAKSMLYLFGLQLDYSTELIGGGFQFSNPNAEESCGCGSSFSV
jgi:iron-sulfur cluster assembly 1